MAIQSERVTISEVENNIKGAELCVRAWKHLAGRRSVANLNAKQLLLLVAMENVDDARQTMSYTFRKIRDSY